MTNFAVWAENHNFSLKKSRKKRNPRKGKSPVLGSSTQGHKHFCLFWHQQVGETTIDEFNDTDGAAPIWSGGSSPTCLHLVACSLGSCRYLALVSLGAPLGDMTRFTSSTIRIGAMGQAQPASTGGLFLRLPSALGSLGKRGEHCDPLVSR